jgi:hypothetical protein
LIDEFHGRLQQTEQQSENFEEKAMEMFKSKEQKDWRKFMDSKGHMGHQDVHFRRRMLLHLSPLHSGHCSGE